MSKSSQTTSKALLMQAVIKQAQNAKKTKEAAEATKQAGVTAGVVSAGVTAVGVGVGAVGTAMIPPPPTTAAGATTKTAGVVTEGNGVAGSCSSKHNCNHRNNNINNRC